MCVNMIAIPACRLDTLFRGFWPLLPRPKLLWTKRLSYCMSHHSPSY